MREIKFRAWVKGYYEDNELIYGEYMIQPHEIKNIRVGEATMLMSGKKKKGIDYFEQGRLLPGMGSLEFISNDEIELMQYTGLKDKNGKEIYDSDIVKGYLRQQDSEFLSTVIFEYGMFKLKFNEVHENIVYEDMTGYNAIELEVIGNIYSNPELVKS